MRIHHIGYVVNDILKSIQEYEQLGFAKESEIVQDVARKVFICFMINGDYRVEFIAPCVSDSPVSNLLNKVGESPYHICYISADLDHDLKTLTSQKYLMIERPSSAVAIEGKRVAFLFKKNVGLIELVGE